VKAEPIGSVYALKRNWKTMNGANKDYLTKVGDSVDELFSTLCENFELSTEAMAEIQRVKNIICMQVLHKDAQLQSQAEVMATDMMRIEATREFLKGETGLDVIGVSNALLKLGFDAEGKRVYSNSKS
jgi:hypothetical protein